MMTMTISNAVRSVKVEATLRDTTTNQVVETVEGDANEAILKKWLEADKDKILAFPVREYMHWFEFSHFEWEITFTRL